jgi:hypothetical protein
MRLDFSVLWFDDNKEYLDNLDIEQLVQDVSSWGFSPNIIKVTTPEEFTSHSPFEKFDLIVVDRNLERYQGGEEFIANLRSNAIYTEVIFYTVENVNGLWDAIHERQLEGVFVSNRSGILSKISIVGHQSIRKVLDLENMRGIVMAEVGALDQLLEEIIEIGVTNLPVEQQNLLFHKFHTGAAEKNQKDSQRIAAFIEKPKITEMLNLCDSENRWRNFSRLLKFHSKLMEQVEIGDFSTEVLRPRNFLAHGRAKLQEDGSYLFYYQGNEYRFDDSTSLRLRQTILRYKGAFSNVLNTLMNG